MELIELLLGQLVNNTLEMTMMTRNNKTYLCKNPDSNWLTRQLTLDGEASRPKVLLAEEVMLQPNIIDNLCIEVVNGDSVDK